MVNQDALLATLNDIERRIFAERERLQDLPARFGAGNLAPFQTPALVAPQATISVRFVDAPRGLRVTTDSSSGANVDTKVGFNLLGMLE